MPLLIVRKISLRFTLLCLSAGLTLVATAATPFPHELGDVPPDPAIRWGRLDNGLRFVVRKNTEPAGRVFLIMQVAVGSVHEREDQRGYAHFVEHMMFRGTKKYPATSIVGFLQHEGLAMGADTSAFTNLTTTFYNLDLPQNSPEKISLGLSILRDFSDSAVINKAEVKREAKVIESERRTRESSATQIGESINEFLNPDTLITRRPPIGTPDSVQNATAEGLLEFYRTWYRPSRITIIAVGDAEPDLLEKLIREQFTSLKPATPAEPTDPDLGLSQPLQQDVQAKFFVSPTPGGTTSILYSLNTIEPAPDTIARRREQIAQTTGINILEARLAEFARKKPQDIGDTDVSWTTEFGLRQQALIRIDTRPDLWRAGVRLAEQELRRALLHGFTPDEVKLQIQGYRNGYQEAIRTASNRESQYIAHAIRSGLEYNFVNSTPDTDWELVEPAVLSLTPEECHVAFQKMWSQLHRRLVVIGHYPAPLSTKELMTAYEESRFASFFSEKDERVIEPFDYTDFGPAGTITTRRHDDRVDIHSLTFANGVQLNLKQTDYEKNHVYLRLRIGRGMSAEPADQPGLGMIASGAFLAGGLQRYDNVELGRRLAADSLSFNFTVEEDGCYFSGYASPDRLEKLLQVVAAFITDPAFREEGFSATMSRLQSHYIGVNRVPLQFIGALTPNIMANGDSRYGLPLPAMIGERTPKQVEDWLRPILATGSIEIGLAGDLDVEKTIAAVSRTMGALPIRQADTITDLQRRPTLPQRPMHENWLLESGEPGKAAVRVYWPGVEGDDYHTIRKLQVLAEILGDRLRVRIREELGATYGAQHDVWGSEAWPGFGYLMVDIECAPKMVNRVTKLTVQIAEDLAKKGVTQDEFHRVIEPRLANLTQELRNNNYWTYHVLSRMAEKPSRVDWPLTRNSDYQAMKREDLNAVARRFLGGKQVYSFIVRAK